MGGWGGGKLVNLGVSFYPSNTLDRTLFPHSLPFVRFIFRLHSTAHKTVFTLCRTAFPGDMKIIIRDRASVHTEKW